MLNHTGITEMMARLSPALVQVKHTLKGLGPAIS